MPNETTRVCCEGDVLIQVAQGIAQKWFEMCILLVLRSMHCNPNLFVLEFDRLVRVDRNVTAVKCFSLDYKRSSCIFIPPVPGVTLVRADGTEVTKNDHEEAHPIYTE